MKEKEKKRVKKGGKESGADLSIAASNFDKIKRGGDGEEKRGEK